MIVTNETGERRRVVTKRNDTTSCSPAVLNTIVLVSALLGS